MVCGAFVIDDGFEGDFITIKNVLMRRDINSETAATMEPFNGHN